MTLNEKITFLGGVIDRFHISPVRTLGLPAVRMADGPQGVRNKTKSTLYPAGIAAAASFNRKAVYDMGTGIALDAKARGVSIMLGPGVNIYRSALNGRNFEYFGEDPYLAAETAVSYIKGMQDNGIIATIKHFAANNQEWDRHSVSSNVDERTLNEIYFPAFRAAVEKAHVGAVMTSYNPINGTHAAENRWLIEDNLRGKWGFNGFVMSDWESCYSSIGTVTGGLDLEMPFAYVMNYERLKPLLDNGVITETEIDIKVQHVLQTLLAFGIYDRPAKDESVPEFSDKSLSSAYNLAVEAPVLLKNEGVLPIKKKSKIVVFGQNATNMPRGGGSGNVHALMEHRISVASAFSALGKNYPCTVLLPVGRHYDTPENIKAIKEADVVIVVVGYDIATEGEGFDRTYKLPKGQDADIKLAAENNKNVVVVAYSGGEYDVNAWKDNVNALLSVWYDGQSGGTAIADILTGKASPSGRLPFTFWGSEEANPVSASYHQTKPAGFKKKSRYPKYRYVDYNEGVFVGYRGVEHFKVTPMYPFGYGLTYTTFSYSGISAAPAGDGFDVSFTLTNTGKTAAAEVAQVYVAPDSPSVKRPARELKGYDKIYLKPGESQKVTIHLDKAAFAHYDTPSHDWKVDAGSYRIQVGASSADIKLETPVKL